MQELAEKPVKRKDNVINFCQAFLWHHTRIQAFICVNLSNIVTILKLEVKLYVLLQTCVYVTSSRFMVFNNQPLPSDYTLGTWMAIDCKSQLI